MGDGTTYKFSLLKYSIPCSIRDNSVAKIIVFSTIRKYDYDAGIAQLVEHSPEERRVGSAILPPSTNGKRISKK